MTGYPTFYRKIEAKTASYTVQPEDLGTLFTTRGAGAAITFTLPPVADVLTGWWAEFYCAADQDLIITAPDEKAVAFNDLTADGISFATASEKIGGSVEVIFDGTSYLMRPSLGIETQTPTIVSA